MRWIIALAVIAATHTAASAVEVSDEFPVVGKPTTITLSAPAESVTFTYQPAAPVAREVVVATGGSQELTWVPEKAGIVTISDGTASKDVSVRFDGVPALGVLIFLGAGFILVGGAAVCLRALFAESHEQ